MAEIKDGGAAKIRSGGVMDNETFNKKIREICDREDLAYPDRDKAIPYIGWFWRDVDFTTATYSFGRIPCEFVGFMENNKWDYPYVDANRREWAKVKKLLVIAVENPTKETCGAVWDYIQSIRKD